MSRPSFLSALAALTMFAAPAAMAAPVPSFVPFDAATQVRGPAAGQSVVHFSVALRLADSAGLDKAIASHRVLTPAELDAYMPGRAGVAAVSAWLRGQGLSVEQAPASRLTVEVSGPASAVGRALGVNFVSVSVGGKDYVSADREPVIPASVAPYIVGVNGLQPQLHAEPMLRKMRDLKTVPLTATGGVPPLYPADLLTAYDAIGLGSGEGATTAIVIDVFPDTADLTSFWSITGVSQKLSNITLIQTNPGTMTASQVETSIDTEQSSSIAPGSHVRVYASVDLSFVDIDKSYAQIIADQQAGVPITQVSASFGACETGVSSSQKTTDDNYFATMTALGASVLVASGDYGAYECGYGFKIGGMTPSFPSTSPHATSVGGTTVTLNKYSLITAETGWSVFAGGGTESGGGGVSKYYAVPSWQSGFGYTGRSTPDVAGDADPQSGILVVYGGGQMAQYGGTSISTPAWAGFMALVNAQRVLRQKAPLGLVAARTTPLLGTNNFHDITVGNNGYSAGVGYDLVTGVGSPDMQKLIVTLVKQP